VGDLIVEYAWDLNGSLSFTNAYGPTPDVTAYFEALGPGEYTVQLRVKDRTVLSYPCSGQPDLIDIDSATVFVKASCYCTTLTAEGQTYSVLLSWLDNTNAAGYNLYRSTISGGPYSMIASTSAGVTSYLDTNVVCDATNFYVVRVTALNGYELCQSEEAGAAPICNVPPVAVCKDIIAPTDPGLCSAMVIDAKAVDGGSYDPNGDVLDFSIAPPGPYP